jgi:hypothetical protein
MAEFLLSKCEALSLNPSKVELKRKKRKECCNKNGDKSYSYIDIVNNSFTMVSFHRECF